MKRVLSFFALMLLPLTLMAMTPISDANLSKVTGQAGVSIEVDMTLNLEFGQLGWGDPDVSGFTNVGNSGNDQVNGGWIGLDNLQISTLHIWPRTDFTMEALGAVTAVTYDANGHILDGGWESLQMVTIDVLTTDQAFDTATGVNTTMVRIGIPTLSITMKEMTGNVVLGENTNTETVGGIVNSVYRYGKEVKGPDFNQMLGRFYVGGLNMALGGGDVLIYAHGRGSMDNADGGTMYGSGVTLEMEDVTVSYLLLNKAAWGDLDGAKEFGSTNSTNGLNNPGWVGLADLTIKDLVLDGKVLIDVASYSTTGPDTISYPTGADPLNPTFAWEDVLPAYDEIYTQMRSQNKIGRTFVQISFDSFVITMDKMFAVAVLNMDAAGLTGGVTTPDVVSGAAAEDQILGDIYVGGMRMEINQSELTGANSYVRIFAH